ncbi:MAG: isopentenyl-diphosphate delta-isomerase [Candidatus Thermoplasmatota archaeon]|nr:isopentenyl-diphosphate delta-isomerase [Candidatus Thermoplasmatota archaeon]MEC8708045.1 isopentenyl-diphosphate delta-isomerase [Candidatus Thermoplasmatota archaeon]MEC8766647.1 isopentenyl-diphosphate delta-isomerase [Candidatus Thermoplasmatota archaeon]
MTGYGIEDVPNVELAIDDVDALQHEDAAQATLMAEAVIAVTEDDTVIGPMSKLEAHQGAGHYHRAFSVLLFNTKGEMLLQQRSSDKVTFPNVWANACCSHPLHSPEELELENAMGVKRAAVRKLEQELGIDPAQMSTDDMVYMTKMRYSARMNQEWIERELDHIIVMCADVEINPNPNEVANTLWVDHDKMEAMLLEERAADQAIAPWFRCIAARIMQPSWWSAFNDKDALADLSDERIHDMGDVTHMLPNAEGADLLTSIMEVKPLIEHRIETSLKASRHERLGNAMMHLIEGGGKRMRATLPWLIAKAVGDSHAGLLDIGAAIETVHNFTLVHDDIMDDDEVRRGRNAVHIEYGLPTAINAGDAMLAIAFERLVQAENLDHEDIPALVNRVAWMVRRVSEGQQLDIEFEDRLNVSEDDYLEMIEGKTAVMFWICAEIGASISGADDETVQLMAEWGKALGLCFQLMDDVIDVLSDSATLGKPAGSDIAQGKRTLMIIHAMQQPDGPVKERLMAVLGKGEEVSEAALSDGLAALAELGSVDYAREKAEAFHAQAHACLDRLPENPALKALRELTDFQLARLH